MAGNASSNKEHPLAGVVLCFTSILPEQRTELATIAGEMGATHKYDLTSDVTHLLVGEVNTPKYKFVARERPDVTVLRPEWVQAVRESWMQGGDTNIRALEERYKLPVFEGLSICITGFEDMSFREHMEKTAVAHGAEFKKDLTKSVTHLVVKNTNGEKYKYAMQWNIILVTLKWFNDSIKRGMVLEEALYHPTLPSEKQGVGAWNRSAPAVKDKVQEHDSLLNPRPRKLRRIASDKLGGQNEGIWNDIVGSGNSEPRGSRTSQQRDDFIKTSRPPLVIQETKSFASETTFPDVQKPPAQSTVQTAAGHADGFLHGCYFFIYGFSAKQVNVLRHHLQFNGAQLVGSLHEFSRPDIPKKGYGLYTIVSYKTPRSEIPSTDDLAFECEVVTDMWLERCLDAKALVPPESHVASTPFSKFPLPGFHGMRICSTGFARIDLLHLSKVVALMGGLYDEYLTPKASVLICNDPRSVNQEKLRHTREWGIPVVSVNWLWNSIRAGLKKPLEPYVVQRASSQDSEAIRTGPNCLSKKERPPHDVELINRNLRPTDKDSSLPPKTQNPSAAPHPEKHSTTKRQIEPVMGDGFLRDSNRTRKGDTTSKSNSQSSSKEQNESSLSENASRKRSGSNQSMSSGATSAFGLALNGLLKQARAANARSLAESGEKNDTSGRRKRMPLTGRANSTTDQSIFSRASSIDTLNEDGCGSAIESINTDGNNTNTRANSANGPQSFTSLLSGARLEFTEDASLYPPYEEDEDQTPAMTQLDYEDPDAAAMRQEFLQSAGRINNKPPAEGAIVGELKELEDAGWGNGRRTRHAAKVVEG